MLDGFAEGIFGFGVRVLISAPVETVVLVEPRFIITINDNGLSGDAELLTEVDV